MFRNGEKGYMLDIGVMFWVVRYQVVDVVVLPVSSSSYYRTAIYIAPPAKTQTTYIVRD